MSPRKREDPPPTLMSFATLSDADLASASEALRAEQRRRRRAVPAPAVPQRELAVESLDVAGVPATPRLVAAVVEARTGEAFDSRRLASQRRDERLAWERDQARGVTVPRVAPALHHERAEPVRALLTLSTWEPRRRVVTPLSPRADRATLILRLAAEAARLADAAGADTAARRLATLAARYALALPGGDAVGYDDPLGRLATVTDVAQLELDRVGPDADAERNTAAGRLAALPVDTQVWGNSLKTAPDERARRAARGRR
jgi:hypothetical protein